VHRRTAGIFCAGSTGRNYLQIGYTTCVGHCALGAFRKGQEIHRELIDILLKATAFFTVSHAGKKMTGTDWLLDKEKKLLITNKHLNNPAIHGFEVGHRRRSRLGLPCGSLVGSSTTPAGMKKM